MTTADFTVAPVAPVAADDSTTSIASAARARTDTDAWTADRSAAWDLAWHIIDRVAQRWTDSQREGVPDPVNPGRTIGWNPLSLEAGDLGLALLYTSADIYAPTAGWDEHAHAHLKEVLTAFTSEPHLRPGLYGGVAGIALALQGASRHGTRYQKAIASVEDALVTRTRHLLTTLDPHRGLPTDAYDMISGLSGIAWYLLHSSAHGLVGSALHEDGPRQELLVDIIDELARRATRLPDAGVGLATAPEQITPVERQYYPYLRDGYINAGFAHGIAGVLAVLGLAEQQGHRGLSPAIDQLRHTLATHLVDTEAGPDTIYYITDYVTDPQGSDLPASNVDKRQPTRSAWCYGNPGLALAARHSETGRSHDGLPLARILLDSALRRRPAEQQIDNPSLCHGYGGLLLIGHALGQPTPDAQARILQAADPDTRFGLRVRHAPGHVVDSPGVLEGSGGAALALLTATQPSDSPTPIQIQLVGRSIHA